jgi:heme A synthase
MFTGIAVVILAIAAWWTDRANNKDRANQYDGHAGEDGNWLLLLHIRQDLKLIAMLLGGVLLMLGISADRH